MLIPEFVALLLSNTDSTKNLRCYTGHWASAVSRVPDALGKDIGRIILLIQAKVNEGLLCDKNQEYLLCYAFEPAGNDYYALGMVVKPLTKIKENKVLEGRPIHIYVNPKTGEVLNDIKVMLETELMSLEDLLEENKRTSDHKSPESYGNYTQYPTSCCYMAISSYKPIDEREMYAGKYDNSEIIHNASVFDSLIEARNYLSNKKDLGRYIFELPGAKENVKTLINKGIGKEIFKIINCHGNYASITPYPEIQREFSFLNEELEHLVGSGLANKAIITLPPKEMLPVIIATPTAAATAAATATATATAEQTTPAATTAIAATAGTTTAGTTTASQATNHPGLKPPHH